MCYNTDQLYAKTKEFITPKIVVASPLDDVVALKIVLKPLVAIYNHQFFLVHRT